MLKKSLLLKGAVLFLSAFVVFVGCSNPAGDTIYNQEGSHVENPVVIEKNDREVIYDIPPELIPFADIDSVGWAYIPPTGPESDILSVTFSYTATTKQIAFPGSGGNVVISEITADKIYIDGFVSVSYKLTGSGATQTLEFTEGVLFPDNLIGKVFKKKLLDPELKNKVFSAVAAPTVNAYFNPKWVVATANSIIGGSAATKGNIQWWTAPGTRDLYIEALNTTSDGPFTSASAGTISKLGDYTYNEGADTVTLGATAYVGFAQGKINSVYEDDKIWSNTNTTTTSYLIIKEKTLQARYSGGTPGTLTGESWFGNTGDGRLYYVNDLTAAGTFAAGLAADYDSTASTLGLGSASITARAIKPAVQAVSEFGEGVLWANFDTSSNTYYLSIAAGKISYNGSGTGDLYEGEPGGSNDNGLYVVGDTTVGYIGDYGIADGAVSFETSSPLATAANSGLLYKLAKGTGTTKLPETNDGVQLAGTKWADVNGNYVSIASDGVLTSNLGSPSTWDWYYVKSAPLNVHYDIYLKGSTGNVEYLGKYNEAYWQGRGSLGANGGSTTGLLGTDEVLPIVSYTNADLTGAVWANTLGDKYFFVADGNVYATGTTPVLDYDYKLYNGIKGNDLYAVGPRDSVYLGDLPTTFTSADPSITFPVNGTLGLSTINKLSAGFPSSTTVNQRWASQSGSAGLTEYLSITSNSFTSGINPVNDGTGAVVFGGTFYTDTANNLFVRVQSDDPDENNLFAKFGTYVASGATPPVVTQIISSNGPLNPISQVSFELGTKIWVSPAGYAYIDGAELNYGPFTGPNQKETIADIYGSVSGTNWVSYRIAKDYATYLGDYTNTDADNQNVFTSTGLKKVDDNIDNNVVASWAEANVAGRRLDLSGVNYGIDGEANNGALYTRANGSNIEIYFKKGSAVINIGTATFTDNSAASLSDTLNFTAGSILNPGAGVTVYKLSNTETKLVGRWVENSATDAGKDGFTILVGGNITFGTNDNVAGGTFVYGSANATGPWWSIQPSANQFYLFFNKRGVWSPLGRLNYTAGSPDTLTAIDEVGPFKLTKMAFKKLP